MNTRELAYEILREIEQKKGYSNIVLNHRLKDVDRRDANFIRAIVYGVLEDKIKLEWIIQSFSKVKFTKIDDKVKIFLSLGIYQIVKMDRVPDSAAVNETVNIAKKHVKRGVEGYINGVLRNVSRNKTKITYPAKKDNLVEYLSIEYSYPKWLIKKLLAYYSSEFVENFFIANTKKSDINIRVNTLKTTVDSLKELLEEKEIKTSAGVYNKDILKISSAYQLTDLDEYKEGLFSIQDESSSLVVKAMDPREGSKVIDVCSAPGGKTTYIAEKMKNRGVILARDIYNKKLKQIENSAKRLGIDIIEVEKYDALKVDEESIGKFDHCLIDAPCSGFGLIRKKPEIKYFKKEEDIKELIKIQYKILSNASKYIKKDGILVYSTCTINPEENILLIKKFLNENAEFKLIGFNENVDIDSANEGYVELFPNVHNMDGFFIAKLVKN